NALRGAVPNPFYIQAPSPLADELMRVLKHGDTFAVFDHYGDVTPSGLGEEGIYHNGTRHLSCFLLLFDEHRSLFLSSTVKEDNDLLTVDLTNPDLIDADSIGVARGTLHVLRTKFLWDGACFERLHFKNFGLAQVDVSFSLHFRADFTDIFEVRGTQRARRGRNLGARVEDSCVVLTYEGLDGVERRTRVCFDPGPNAVLGTEAFFRVVLPPHGEAAFDVTIYCEQYSGAAHSGAAPGIMPPALEGGAKNAQTQTLGFDGAHARAAA